MDENLTISNSAAGVLAHLAADDPESWTIEKPSRETVKNRLRDTVNNWDLESRRNVRYRYRFETIPYFVINFLFRYAVKIVNELLQRNFLDAEIFLFDAGTWVLKRNVEEVNECTAINLFKHLLLQVFCSHVNVVLCF